MSFIAPHQWYRYQCVSRSWRHALDHPNSYQFLRQNDYVRDRYIDDIRQHNAFRARGLANDRNDNDNDEALCMQGCCHSDKHYDERNDESDEYTDDEPFTNDDTGQVDVKEKTRWNVQRGSTIWKHQMAISDEQLEFKRLGYPSPTLTDDSPQPSSMLMPRFYRLGMEELKRVYSDAPSELNHQQIATQILDIDAIFTPLFGLSIPSIPRSSTSNSHRIDDDTTNSDTNTESSSIANEMNHKRRRVADTPSLSSSCTPSPSSPTPSLPFSIKGDYPPLYLLPVPNGHTSDVILDRWFEPLLASSPLHYNDPNTNATAALNELLTSPSLSMSTMPTPISSSIPSMNDSNDTLILNSLLPTVWPLPSSSSNCTGDITANHPKWWSSIGSMGTFGHGVFDGAADSRGQPQSYTNGADDLTACRQHLRHVIDDIRRLQNGDDGEYKTDGPPVGDAVRGLMELWTYQHTPADDPQLPDEWRSILLRLLRIVRRFPTFGVLIWISHICAHLNRWDMANAFFDRAFLVMQGEPGPLETEFQIVTCDYENQQRRKAGRWLDDIHNGIHALMRRTGVLRALPQSCELISRFMNMFIRDTLRDAITCYHQRQSDIDAYYTTDDDDDEQLDEDDNDAECDRNDNDEHEEDGKGDIEDEVKDGNGSTKQQQKQQQQQQNDIIVAAHHSSPSLPSLLNVVSSNTLIGEVESSATTTTMTMTNTTDAKQVTPPIDAAIKHKDDIIITTSGTTSSISSIIGSDSTKSATPISSSISSTSSEGMICLTSADIQAALLIPKSLWLTTPVWGHEHPVLWPDSDGEGDNDDDDRIYIDQSEDDNDDDDEPDEKDDELETETKDIEAKESMLNEFDLPNEPNSDVDDDDDKEMTIDDDEQRDRYQMSTDIKVNDSFAAINSSFIRLKALNLSDTAGAGNPNNQLDSQLFDAAALLDHDHHDISDNTNIDNTITTSVTSSTLLTGITDMNESKEAATSTTSVPSSVWAHHRKRRYIDGIIVNDMMNDIADAQYKRAKYHHDNGNPSHDWDEGEKPEPASVVDKETTHVYRPDAIAFHEIARIFDLGESPCEPVFHLSCIRWLVNKHLDELLPSSKPSSNLSSSSSSSSSLSLSSSIPPDKEDQNEQSRTRISDGAMLTVRASLEAALILMLESATAAAVHCKRIYIAPIDIAFAIHQWRHSREFNKP